MNIPFAKITLFILMGAVHGCGKEGSDNRNAAPLEDPSEDAESSDVVTTDLTYLNFAKPILDEKCSYCHNNPASRGAPTGFRLDSYDELGGYLGVSGVIPRMLKVMKATTMPPVSENIPLSADENAKFIEWLSAGAPKGEGKSPSNEPEIELQPSALISAPTAIDDDPELDGTYIVRVLFEDVVSQFGWSLHYTLQPGATSGGTLIAGGIDVATNQYTWDTTALADGSYYVYIQVITSAGVLRASSPGSVEVVNP